MRKNILWCFLILLCLSSLVWFVADYVKTTSSIIKTMNNHAKNSEKYTTEEINSALKYVGSYNYIHKIMDNAIIQCLNIRNSDSDIDNRKECEEIVWKEYSMAHDETSIKKMNSKYQEQLAIVKYSLKERGE